MKYSLFILIISFSITITAQDWQAHLPTNKNASTYTLHDYQKAFNTYWDSYNIQDGYYMNTFGVKQKAPGWKLFKRWEYYWESRVNQTTGCFPKNAAIDMYNNWGENAQGTDMKRLAGNWQSINPSSSTGGYTGAGRINVIAFHPSDSNTYWVGTPSGGLWKTSDDGNTWTTSTDNNDVLGVSEIAISANFEEDQTIYIGTGDRDRGSLWSLGSGNNNDNNSIGVLKSLDGGANWNTTGLSFIASEGIALNSMLLDPNNNNTLYVATSAGLYKTTDAGGTWNILTTAIYIDIKFKPGDSSIIYASSWSGEIFKSTNSGNSFSNVLSTTNGRTELAVSPNNPNIVYALMNAYINGKVYKSTDSGNHFIETYIGSKNLLGWSCDGMDYGGQGSYDLCIATDPTDANSLFIGGINTWKSTDGGLNWQINTSMSDFCDTAIVHSDIHYIAFQNDTNAIFQCNDGGVYTTLDNGTNWTDKSNGIVNSQIYRIGVSQTEVNTTITGLQDNGTKIVSSDGVWKDAQGGDGMECIIDYTDYQTQYGIMQNGRMHSTTNAWENRNLIHSFGGAWVTPYVLDQSHNNILYAGYKNVEKSTNQGVTWTAISTMNTSEKLRSLAVSPSNSAYIYAADPNRLWVTTNGGDNWAERTAGLPVLDNMITYIEVKNDDPNTVWVTFGGYDADRIYESTDAGENWTNIATGLPHLPTMCVIQNIENTDETELYVGTDKGVYIKIGTNDWQEYQTGLPNVVITELDIYYDETSPENSRLRAATYGRGLWEVDLNTIPIAPMIYEASTTTQNNTAYLVDGDVNKEIIGIEIRATGSEEPIALSSFTFNTIGSTNPITDIVNAKVFYTNHSNSFDTSVPFGSVIANPNGSFTINGAQTLIPGTNYFWLVYDINETAVSGNVVDATCVSITVNGINETPTVISPEGNRRIAAETDHFVTTWKTDNTGTSNDTSIEIPTYSDEVYDYDIDWNNDGIFDEFGVTGNITHNFDEIGTYTIRIRGDFPRIYFNSHGDCKKILNIDQWGGYQWTSMVNAFSGCFNLNGSMSDNPNLSKVTHMNKMFYRATSFNQDIGNWDVSTIKDMSYMFCHATSFNQNIGNWDVSSVKNMSKMFEYAEVFDQEIGTWNVSNVTDMSDLFSYANAFNKDIGSWDVSHVGNMSHMFSDTASFNQGIGNWDVGNVADMSNMFSDAASFNQNFGNWNVGNVADMNAMFADTASFNQDIGNWNVSNVADMNAMFSDAASFNQNIGNWNVGNVSDMSKMFSNADAFNNEIGNWNVSNVTNMWAMFSGTNTFNQEIGNWNVSNVRDMSAMFSGADVFDQEIGNWNVANVRDMKLMFKNAALFNQNINNWDVSSVRLMNYMFDGASLFNQFIGDWNVSSVINMNNMFDGASLFNQDIGNWNVSNVTYMKHMFSHATSFNQDIGDWDVSKVTLVNGMFGYAINFDQDLGNWNVSNITQLNNMFYHATSFNQDIGGWNISSVINMMDMFRNATSFNQNIGNWDVSNVSNMSNMFMEAISFNQDIGMWNVENVIFMSNMFENATLSTENYDSLLLGWDAQNLHSNLSFNGGNSQYCDGALARTHMTSPIADGGDNWNITDGGSVDDCTVAINEIILNDISIYPNPSSGIFNLTWSNELNLTIKVTDISGKIILSSKNITNEKGTYSLNLSDVADGVYFITFSSDNHIFAEKLIVQ